MKISVIIPVYNVEDYLTECIDSVISQTLDGIEIICVNDGSSDKSYEILKKYGKEYKNITIINQENKGVGAARNMGLKQAVGKYIYFLDGDDFLTHKNALDILFQECEAHDLEIALFDSKKVYEDGRYEYLNRYKELGFNIMTGEEAFNIMVENNCTTHSVWIQLFNREFLAKTETIFYEDMIYEDILFSVLSNIKAKKVKHVGKVLHCYRVRDNSIMTNKITEESIDGHYIAAKGLYKFLKEYTVNNNNERTIKNLRYYSKLFYQQAITDCDRLNCISKRKLIIGNMDKALIDENISIHMDKPNMYYKFKINPQKEGDVKEIIYILDEVVDVKVLEGYISNKSKHEKYVLISKESITDESIKKFFDEIYELNKCTQEQRNMVYFHKVMGVNYSTCNNNYREIYIYKKGKFLKSELNKEIGCLDELIEDNKFYGAGIKLKEFCGYKNVIHAHMEHAMFRGRMVRDRQEINTIYPAIIAFSDYRYDCLRVKTSRQIFSVGPYIHYTNEYLNKNIIKEIKNNIGKTLVVFPTHSIDNVHSEYCIDEFIEYIDEFKSKYRFDTVLVCMYWKDIELGKGIKYMDKGWTIISAGHRDNNPYFYDRLRRIIEISDYTLSNDVGTHIGYSLFFNKPHTLYNQHVSLSGSSKKELELEMNARGSNAVRNMMLEKFRFIELFNGYTENIKKEQYDFCNHYWGFDKIKSKDEILFILSFCEEMYTQCYEKIYKGITQEELNNIYFNYIVEYIESNKNDLIMKSLVNY